MKTLSRLFLMVLLLANVGFMAMVSLHVVKSPAGTVVVPKSHLTLVDSYVDVTNWSISDKDSHAAFVNRVNDAGKSYLLNHLGSASSSTQVVAPEPKKEITKTPVKIEKPEDPAPKSIFPSN